VQFSLKLSNADRVHFPDSDLMEQSDRNIYQEKQPPKFITKNYHEDISPKIIPKNYH